MLVTILATIILVWVGFSRYQETLNQKQKLLKLALWTKGELIGEFEGIKSQEKLRFYVPITDRKTMVDWVANEYMKREDSKALRNLIDSSERLHILGKPGDKAGAIYIDTSAVDPTLGGDILITGNYFNFWKSKMTITENLTIDFNPPPREPSIHEILEQVNKDRMELEKSISSSLTTPPSP